MEIDLEKLTPDVRHLSDMKEVLFDQAWAKDAQDTNLYLMYRKVTQEDGINHSVTIVPVKMLGKEFVKTKGHVHIGNFQEIYTVEEGQALYLMQKGDAEKITDVFVVQAKKGESIIIPSGYGHVTINPSETEDLKTGDWTSENCKSDYSLFEKNQGACYYYTTEGWIKNEHYKIVPALRFVEPLKLIPQSLDFLKAE